MASLPPLPAGIYCRLSDAALGDTTNVDDQEARCRKVAENRGWQVAAVYKDNSRSAWQRNRSRPGWEQMLADIEAGVISAIIVYHGDRLMRQPWDLEILLRLAEDRGIRLASPTGERDLSSPDDQYILRIEVAHACRESASTSRRVKRYLEGRRGKGLLRTGGAGGRTFGFATDGETHVPAEADAIREAARRILAGEPAAAIARDLTARGITGTGGKPLNYQRLAAILSRPQNAGLLPDGISKAGWAPIIDREVWEEVRALLAVRGASHGRVSRGTRFLLSGLIICGSCEKPMTAWYVKGGRHVYKCVNKGCSRKLSRSQPALDNYITGRIVGYLNSPAVTRQVPEPVEDKALAAQIAVLEQQRDGLQSTLDRIDEFPTVSPLSLVRSIDRLNQRIAAKRAEAGSQRKRVLTRHAGITVEKFRSLPLGLRRQLVSAAYRITILPASRMGPGFREEDVRVRLRED